MNYNNVKLGLIDKFKIWRERRAAEKIRKMNDKLEHEVSEVDYSAADRLKSDLLEQKRIKRATKDASRIYKTAYGKNNDGIGMDDYIEQYLLENGLKKQILPIPRGHNFMQKYSVEKSKDELAYEREKNIEKINDEKNLKEENFER